MGGPSRLAPSVPNRDAAGHHRLVDSTPLTRGPGERVHRGVKTRRTLSPGPRTSLPASHRFRTPRVHLYDGSVRNRRRGGYPSVVMGLQSPWIPSTPGTYRIHPGNHQPSRGGTLPTIPTSIGRSPSLGTPSTSSSMPRRVAGCLGGDPHRACHPGPRLVGHPPAGAALRRHHPPRHPVWYPTRHRLHGGRDAPLQLRRATRQPG